MSTKKPGNYYLKNSKDKILFNAKYWWLQPKNDVHTEVFANAREYYRRWSVNYTSMISNKNRYEEREVAVGIAVSPFSKLPGGKYLSAGVTSSVIDTLVSKIAKSVPSVTYVTSNGDWFEQQQAKDLEKYVQGVFLNSKIHGKLRDQFGDACKVGTGFMLMEHYAGQLRFTNYPAYQVMCDWIDAQEGHPTDIHFIDVVNRFKLMQQYPEHKEKLLKTSSNLFFYSETNMGSPDSVMVVKSYNMFARRNTVCVENCTLYDDEELLNNPAMVDDLGRPMAPYVALQYKDTSYGLFSIGLAEEIRSLHEVVDRTLRIIQRSSYLGAVPKVFVPRAANVIESEMNNEIGGIIQFDGIQPPIPMPLMKIPTDLNELVNYYYELAFKKCGLSQLSATSQKPQGLDSGKALRTYYDIETDRFQSIAKAYEQNVVNLNYLIIKFSKYLSDIGYSPKAKFYGRSIQKEIDFKKVNLDLEYFDIQAYPTSIIPQTPAGRYETVRDMLQMGLLDQQRALKLLDIPDIENDISLQNSPLDYIRFQIYEIMNGRMMYPDQRQDIQMVIREAQNHYMYYKQRDMNFENLELLSSFIEEAKALATQTEKDATQVAQQMAQQMMLFNQQQQGEPQQ